LPLFDSVAAWSELVNGHKQDAPVPKDRRVVWLLERELVYVTRKTQPELGAVNPLYPADGPTGAASLLTHVGQSGGQPVFSFDTGAPH